MNKFMKTMVLAGVLTFLAVLWLLPGEVAAQGNSGGSTLMNVGAIAHFASVLPIFALDTGPTLPNCPPQAKFPTSYFGFGFRLSTDAGNGECLHDFQLPDGTTWLRRGSMSVLRDKQGNVVAVRFNFRDDNFKEYLTSDIPAYSVPQPPVATGFTVHVDVNGAAIFSLKGKQLVGSISVGDVVFTPA